ncbi:hypothetical protein ISS96_01275 [Candidatus Bathyarchaeota archaeon]|nr:hypothetical protein [Candidatus Bathyarchaeota archaeon]
MSAQIDPSLIEIIKIVLLAFTGPVTAWIMNYYNNKRMEERFQKEQHGRLLQSLLNQRSEALQEINARMVEAYYKILRYANVGEDLKKKEREEVMQSRKEFEDTLNEKSIWLDEEAQKVLDDVRGAFIGMTSKVYFHSGLKVKDWNCFHSSFNHAKKILRERMAIPKAEMYLTQMLNNLPSTG